MAEDVWGLEEERAIWILRSCPSCGSTDRSAEPQGCSHEWHEQRHERDDRTQEDLEAEFGTRGRHGQT